MTTRDESIAHWEKLATEADAFAAYEESRGSSGAAYRENARTYRRTAESLRLQESTGLWHCVCCLKPKGQIK